MVLVVLGTQDMDFSRLLKAVEKEVINGHIKDKVIVQAGQTKYESKYMEIFDLLPAPEFDKLMDEADLIITHGGAGSILGAIKKGKKVIAAARLKKYGEHHNDHQKQIIEEFSKLGYIMELKDFHKLGLLIDKSKKFSPKKFVSNTDNMIKLIKDYIDDTNHISWYNRNYSLIQYYIQVLFIVIINFIFFLFFQRINFSLMTRNIFSWASTFSLDYLLHYFVFVRNNDKNLFNGKSYIVSRIIVFFLDMILMYLLVNMIFCKEILLKAFVAFIVFIINSIVGKIFFMKS